MNIDHAITTLSRGIDEIYRRQLEIAEQRIYGNLSMPERVKRRTGHLRDALAARRYSVSRDGQGVRTTADVPLYLRFLDMKRFGNHQIYNRQVYGILYHQVLNRIKYGFTDEMAQQIRDELIRAGAYLK